MKTEARKESQHRWHGKRYKEFRALIDEIKIKYGCVDCGYKEHPAALQFDHIDPLTKSFKVGASVCRNLVKVLEEISKCEVLCANCHAIKTASHKVVRKGLKPFIK